MAAAATPVAVLASRVRGEERQILAAFERRGIPVTHVDPRDLPYRADDVVAPWPVVLNREISATRARYAARSMEAAGAVVVNSAAATELCGDKWLSTLALRRAGLPMPRTSLALTPDAALACIEEFGYPVVIKPLTSSWGKRVALVRERDAAQAVLEHCAALPAPQAHVIYLQEYIDKPGRDLRVIVVGGRPVGAVYRSSAEWRTNVARGAETTVCPLTPALSKLATDAARAVGAEIAGVDLVETTDSRILVLEVNQGVEFTGFRRAHGDSEEHDVAAAIVDLVLARTEAVNRP
jgi:[lysine-biosynthesis-protein LysW]--L-2-aminoadipate ligase